jgi:hypothetical protein
VIPVGIDTAPVLAPADELALRDLVARYHDAVCLSDPVAWAATWAPDAEWHLTQRTLTGRDAIVEFWTNRILPPYEGRLFQLLGQGRVWATADGAAGRWTFLDIGRKVSDGHAHMEVCCYRDRYVRDATDAQWRFAERRFSLAYSSWIDPGEFRGFPPV